MNGGEHGKRVVICFVFILLWVQTRDQFQTETRLLFVSDWMDFKLRLKRRTFSVRVGLILSHTGAEWKQMEVCVCCNPVCLTGLM